MRRGLLALPLLFLVVGCGAEPEGPAPVVVTQEQPVMNGFVDDETKAAVGLAINVFDVFFTGHCSGTLISPNVVLTARHCVSLQAGGQPSEGVVCGQSGFRAPSGGEIFRVTTVTVRPGADGPSFYKGVGEVVVPEATDLCGADIALIVLEGAGIPESETPIIVPRIDRMAEAQEPYSAVGYGLTNPNDNASSGTRYRFDGAKINCVGERCAYYDWAIKANEWEGTAPTCPGDSGGPALDAQGRVIGVLSRGPAGCISSMYGDVWSHRELITSTVLAAAASAGIEAPYWAREGTSEPEPEPDPVGVTCTEEAPTCPKGWPCQLHEGGGVCVQPCVAEGDTCYEGYECRPEYGACVDPALLPPAAAAADESGGCAVARPGLPTPASRACLVAAAALGLGRLRRRARRA